MPRPAWAASAGVRVGEPRCSWALQAGGASGAGQPGCARQGVRPRCLHPAGSRPPSSLQRPTACGRVCGWVSTVFTHFSVRAPEPVRPHSVPLSSSDSLHQAQRVHPRRVLVHGRAMLRRGRAYLGSSRLDRLPRALRGGPAPWLPSVTPQGTRGPACLSTPVLLSPSDMDPTAEGLGPAAALFSVVSASPPRPAVAAPVCSPTGSARGAFPPRPRQHLPLRLRGGRAPRQAQGGWCPAPSRGPLPVRIPWSGRPGPGPWVGRPWRAVAVVSAWGEGGLPVGPSRFLRGPAPGAAGVRGGSTSTSAVWCRPHARGLSHPPGRLPKLPEAP